MSIKIKLTAFICFIVGSSLVVHIYLSYTTFKANLLSNLENGMGVIANQLAVYENEADAESRSMEDAAAGELRLAALAAQNELGSDAARVTGAQLAELCEKTGISQISLLVRSDSDIVILKSTIPGAVNLGTKDWGYYHTAFEQLFSGGGVQIPEGRKLPNFWSDAAVSGQEPGGDRGFYFDGTTNYITALSINDERWGSPGGVRQPSEMAAQLMQENPALLGIAAYDPLPAKDSGKEIGNHPVSPNEVRVLFGSYPASWTEGTATAANVYLRNKTLTEETFIQGRKVIQTFVPVSGVRPLVISIATDYSIIQKSLANALKCQLAISAALLAVVAAACYVLAIWFIRPLQLILKQVEQIAAGHFGLLLGIRRKDEFGLLASRINTMSASLKAYTLELESTVDELSSTKENFESFLSHTGDAIEIVDREGKVVLVNEAYENLYGWTRDELLGRSPVNVSRAYREGAQEIFASVIGGGIAAGVETLRRRKDGKKINVSLTASPIRNAAGTVISVATISRDITGRKQTEELLRRSEKLSVIGQLAAGVAHEIRNPLTTLRGFVQLQKAQGQGNPQHLDLMLSELDRINFIVSEFMVLSKPQAFIFRYKRLDVLIDELLLLVEPQALLSAVRIIKEFEPGVPAVKCEEIQLKQVFINLLKNSIEAMPAGGDIRIQVKSLDVDRVLLRIIDEGAGIPEEQLCRLGEPFFTNKETGNGLGLMVSQQIIANHKGEMQIRSELGTGTTVDVVLPVHQ